MCAFRINGLKYPAADRLTARTSTICRAMACTLLLREPCTQEQDTKWRHFFPAKICAYCGKEAVHLDHLHPLIEKREPTGYGTEPANLVPCCRECNQKKSSMHWEEFMRSEKCNHIGDATTADPQIAMENRIRNIRAFQDAFPPNRIVLDKATKAKWNELLSKFDADLKQAQELLLEMKGQLYPQQE